LSEPHRKPNRPFTTTITLRNEPPEPPRSRLYQSGAQWQSCRVKDPVGHFKIAAQGDSDAGWFAFKAPRELGRLSFWAIQLLKSRKHLLLTGWPCSSCNLATLRARTWHPDHPPVPATPQPNFFTTHSICASTSGFSS